MKLYGIPYIDSLTCSVAHIYIPILLLIVILYKSMAEFESVNATYFKFMFVRHPMRRMLSCYMDKMVVKPYPQLVNFWAEIRNYTQNVRYQHQGARQQKIVFF